jgi:hypothetical protein
MVVHIPEHQKWHKMEVQGNRMADEVAKEVLLQPEAPIFHLTTIIPPPSITPKICLQEGNDYQNWGLQNSQGKMDFT